MGTFEKLGILVIVVIIVMILAVAIYQWGGNEADSPLALDTGGVPGLTVRDIDEIEGPADSEGGEVADDETGGEATADEETWPGGVPRVHTLRKNDNLWVLVFSKWRLQDSFIKEIVRANPGLNPKRLRPGRKIAIPNPSGFFRGKRGEATSRGETQVVYEVQIGDTLESIARMHLGRKSRWHEIADLNPGLRPERLRPGQKILLPALR
jgi:nucleoid-associated protein YgaU